MPQLYPMHLHLQPTYLFFDYRQVKESPRPPIVSVCRTARFIDS
ncbi:hypothetical protein HMPREF1861_01637 [Corynebacterium kroppenstedtii]|nr:hypothetical protein HMPREF1861_01637 [Corynebacterium kroppenstedtii]